MREVGTHKKSGSSIHALNVPTWKFITKSKKSRKLRRQSVVNGRPITATIEENPSIFEELVCSEEDETGTHNSNREIAPRISINKSSFHRLVNKKNLHCYKRLKTPKMNSASCKRRADRTGKLLQRFCIPSSSRLVFKMRKTFPFKYQLFAKTIEFI